jgi:hypothetical protein
VVSFLVFDLALEINRTEYLRREDDRIVYVVLVLSLIFHSDSSKVYPHRKCRDAQRIVALLHLADVEVLHCALGPVYFVFKLSICIPRRALSNDTAAMTRM